MKRVLTAAGAALAIGLLALPGGATARRHGHGHKHAVKHGARHGSKPGKVPTLASLTAGTVTSYDGTTLVVTLTNGSVVSALADAKTHLMCAVLPPGFPGGTTGPTGPTGSTRHEGYPPGAGDKPGPPGDKPGPPEGYHPPKPPTGPRPYWLKPCPATVLPPGTLVHAFSIEATPAGVRYTGLGLILTAPPSSGGSTGTS
jgi:hypothetical protein